MTDETKQKPDKANRNYGGGAKEWIVSTIAGVLSGAVAAGHTVREVFLDEAKSRAGLADLSYPKNQAEDFLRRVKGYLGKDLKVLGTETIDGVEHIKIEGLVNRLTRELKESDLKNLGKPTNWHERANEIRGLKKAYTLDSGQFIANEYGEVVSGWRGLLNGTFRQFPVSFSDNSRNKVMYAGLTAATIIGVGMYNLLTSIATRKKAREIEDLILDKVLDEPMAKVEAAHRAMHAEPENKVTQVTTHERLQAANAREMTVRA